MLRRAVAALIALVAYVVLWQLFGIAFVLVAWLAGFDIPGYHEVPPAWWTWTWSLIWVAGAIGVVWFFGFRVEWWRRRLQRKSGTRERAN